MACSRSFSFCFCLNKPGRQAGPVMPKILGFVDPSPQRLSVFEENVSRNTKSHFSNDREEGRLQDLERRKAELEQALQIRDREIEQVQYS